MIITEGKIFNLYTVLAGLIGYGWWQQHKEEVIPKIEQLKHAVNDQETREAISGLKKLLSPDKFNKVMKVLNSE